MCQFEADDELYWGAEPLFGIKSVDKWQKSPLRRPVKLRVSRPQANSLFKQVARALTGTCRSYVESTTSNTGRPALRLGSHWSRNNRHQRIQPLGTQMRATV